MNTSDSTRFGGWDGWLQRVAALAAVTQVAIDLVQIVSGLT